MKITKEDLLKIERAVRRELYLERNCPHFKGGVHQDKKKEKDKKRCRKRIRKEDWR